MRNALLTACRGSEARRLALGSGHDDRAFRRPCRGRPQGCPRRLADGHDSVDYPDFGARLGRAIAEGKADRGIAVCGSGIGISIAVNRNPACRCALVNEPLSAALAREHNDANVIAMGARLTGIDMAKACVTAFLSTDFGGGRHQRRVDKLSNPPASRETA